MPPAPRAFLLEKPRPLPENCEIFSCGRDALLAALELENFRAPRKVWLPEFFCPALSRNLAPDAGFYQDFPSEPAPRFETLKPKKGDAVVAVNFFGLRGPEIWENFFASRPDVLAIRDNSHAPLCEESVNPPSGYSFASLRKTLPLPDGGCLFGKNLKARKIFREGGESAPFAQKALAAAALRGVLGYRPEVEKLYYEGENALEGKRGVSRVSKYSAEILARLDVEKIARKTLRNLLAFRKNFEGFGKCRELGASPAAAIDPFRAFCPTLKFSDPRLRDKCHNALFDIGAMPSIYWGGLGRGVSARTREESNTILSIPLDFRHSQADAARIAEFISGLCAEAR